MNDTNDLKIDGVRISPAYPFSDSPWDVYLISNDSDLWVCRVVSESTAEFVREALFQCIKSDE